LSDNRQARITIFTGSQPETLERTPKLSDLRAVEQDLHIDRRRIHSVLFAVAARFAPTSTACNRRDFGKPLETSQRL